MARLVLIFQDKMMDINQAITNDTERERLK